MTNGITLTDKRIEVVAPFTMKDALKAIPGSKWDSAAKCWCFPLNTLSALTVNMRVPLTVPRSSAFRLYLVEARAEEQDSETVRVAEDLPLPAITIAEPRPWNHQIQAYHFSASKKAAMLSMDMGCLDGETEVIINRGGASKRVTLAHLHHKHSGGTTSIGNGGQVKAWDLEIPTMIRCMRADGSIGLAPIRGTKYTGNRPVVRVSLADGSAIRCTLDHEIVTPSGKRQAAVLQAGDLVLTAPTTRNAPNLYAGPRNATIDGRYFDKDGYVRVWGTGHTREAQGGIVEHIIVAEAMIGRPLAAGEEVHHLDRDRGNNDPGNLQVLARAQHLEMHRDQRMNLPGTATQAVAVLDVKTDGYADVYDVSVAEDAHTYIANGIVVGNTGKTRVAIDLMQNSDDKRVLIICPHSVIPNWPRELRKYLVHPEQWHIVMLDRDVRTRTTALRDALAFAELHGKGVVIITNYEGAWRDPLGKRIKATAWDRVILDESHRIKSPQGVASKFMAGFALTARRRLALTGTPFAHSLLDIFGQYRFLDPAIYGGSYYVFQHTYAEWGGYNNHELLTYKDIEELQRRFHTIAFTVKASDVLDLPEAVHVQRYVTLGARAQKMYDDMDEEFVAWVREGVEVTAGNALVKLLRLQQITSGFMPTDADTGPNPEPIDSGKMDALRDVLDDLPEGEPVVVFCRFRADLDAVHATAAAAGRSSAELSGRRNELALWQGVEQVYGTPRQSGKTDELKRRIADGGLPSILAVQIQSGGVGIDLTRARYCVYYSLGFSLSDYAQSLARVHRPGQTRNVTYVHLLAEKTIDVEVHEALQARQDVVDGIMRRNLG